VAKAFFANVFKLHWLPLSKVSDRDFKFVSIFWQLLFSVLGSKLKMATDRHQPTDGQSENVTSPHSQRLSTSIALGESPLPKNDAAYSLAAKKGDLVEPQSWKKCGSLTPKASYANILAP
jgi:hypothetical protein